MARVELKEGDVLVVSVGEKEFLITVEEETPMLGEGIQVRRPDSQMILLTRAYDTIEVY